jgi:hypothetical protein
MSHLKIDTGGITRRIEQKFSQKYSRKYAFCKYLRENENLRDNKMSFREISHFREYRKKVFRFTPNPKIKKEINKTGCLETKW